MEKVWEVPFLSHSLSFNIQNSGIKCLTRSLQEDLQMHTAALCSEPEVEQSGESEVKSLTGL